MNETLNCIVIEDEALQRHLMEAYISQTPFLKLIGSFTNAVDAIQLIEKIQIDLIITDVKMPQIDGIQFARIVNRKSMIILASSFGEYAVAGFDINAVDFLLKPFNYDRFLEAIAKAQALHMRMYPDKKDVTNNMTVSEHNTFFVKSSGKIIRIRIDDILFIEARKEYISIVTDKNEKILVLSGISAIENVLVKYGFLKIHRSYLVSLGKIEEIESNSVKIKQYSIPVAIAYKQTLFDAIQQTGIIFSPKTKK